MRRLGGLLALGAAAFVMEDAVPPTWATQFRVARSFQKLRDFVVGAEILSSGQSNGCG
jgi:hypothetical protein